MHCCIGPASNVNVERGGTNLPQQDFCDDWLGAVSVDPDAIDLALPPPASGVAEDLSLVGFHVRAGLGVLRSNL